MALTENEKKTRELYDLNGRAWLERSGGANRPSFWEEEMALFEAKMQGKNVLEVGAGPATDGKFLIEKGFNVISTDYSMGMLKIAQENGNNPDLAQVDMNELSFKNDSFDGFLAIASILHLQNPIPALKELVRVTKNGGYGFITVKEGSGDKVDEKSGFYFHYFIDTEFQGLLAQNKLEVLEAGQKEGTPNHRWLTYLVKVNK